MRISAIIAEYNPFHNGHKYHIQKTRALGATHIVAIMSGNYTQRGAPAIADKRIRAAAALSGGVDLVLELPLPYAMATAQRFACGAVGIAQGLGCVDMLSFGSESGYLSIIEATSQAIDSPIVTDRVREILSQGTTYAKARQMAVTQFFGEEMAQMIAKPNDSLGVEYLRQLRLQNSTITPFVVPRHTVSHHENKVIDGFSSATYIRELWQNGSIERIKELLPSEGYQILLNAIASQKAPLDTAKFHQMIMPILRKMTALQIKKIPDISEGLENRIYAAIRQSTTMDEVYALSKSKRYTAARIRRVVMSAFLGLEDTLGQNPPPYIRVLGFNGRGREILSAAKKTSSLPISDSLAYLRKVNATCAAFAEIEGVCVDLYNLALPKVLPCGYDFIANAVRIL